MKETTGATILMGMATVIILIFIIMVSFFISYGKAFSLKNLIINRIEQQEGMSASELTTFVNTGNGYVGKKIQACYEPIYFNNAGTRELSGFIIRVRVSFGMDRTILGENLDIKVPIVGETRIIQRGSYLGDPPSESELSYRLGLVQCSTGRYTTV